MTASAFRPRPGIAALLLALAAGALAGCVQKGDFGRVAPSAWNGLLTQAGDVAADLRDEPVSAFPLTDDERELRQRAWRFLTPGKDYPLFDRMLAELAATRVLPASWHPSDPALYHEGLLAGPFRSPASRYRRLTDDVVADGRLIPAFAATAGRVVDADLVRLRGLPFVKTLAEADIRNAAARVAENRCLIAWVRYEVGARVAAYRYALEHLLIEVPGRDAVGPERAIAGLAERLPLLANLMPFDPSAPCGFDGPPPVVGATIVAKG